MKRIISPVFILAALLPMILLNGCIKDTCRQTFTYTMYVPVYKTNEEVRANIKNQPGREMERPGKLFIKGHYIFLNEVDKGIHVIDNSDASNPRNISFIEIPGNVDLAVKGNILYADMYTDLVTIDISNPENVSLKKVLEGVFPFRYYHSSFALDSTKVIAEWVHRDTTIIQECNNFSGFWGDRNMLAFSNTSSSESKGGAGSPYGMGGSMARFSVVHERLYTVSDQDLTVFNIQNMVEPAYNGKVNIGQRIETLYPFKNNLFIGSASGMFIYDISNADNPKLTGQFGHVQSCDPVIADDEYAYVTLRSGTECQGFTNQLEVLKLNALTNPSLVKIYTLTNPHGLSKDGNLLFICDGSDGLKVFNASSPSNIYLVKHLTGLTTYDVITWNNKAIVSANDGLYQYDYSNINNIRLLSKINYNK